MNLDIAAYVKRIVSEKTPYELLKGNFLFREGDPYESTFFLVDGEVSILKGKHALWVAKPNELIGLSTFFSNSKSYGFSAKIIENCKVLMIDGDALNRIMGSDTGFSKLVIDQLCHRIKLTNNRTKNLIETPSKYRLVHLLVDKAKKTESTEFSCNLDELSESVGISTRLIRRKLTELQNKNLVNYKNGRIQICDLKGLEIFGATPRTS